MDTPWDRMAKALNRKMPDSERMKVISRLDAEAREFRHHDDERIASFLESQRCITLSRIIRKRNKRKAPSLLHRRENQHG